MTDHPASFRSFAILFAMLVFLSGASAFATEKDTPEGTSCHGPATETHADHADDHDEHAGHDEHAAHAAMMQEPAAGQAPEATEIELEIPDTKLVDQNGRDVRFGPDLVDGKLVAVNFVFTTCTTICPPMGANFGQLQKLLGERAGRDVHLVSVSIDPAVDTPERLAAWGETFGANDDAWTLVTGEKPLVDGMLRQLGVFVADKQYHSPIVLLGNAATGEWRRTTGLTPAARLLETLDSLASPTQSATLGNEAESEAESEVETEIEAPLVDPAREYFTDTVLVDQHGAPRHFYTDLLEDHVVVINAFFTSCTGVCPVMAGNLVRVQDWLGERLGEEVRLISISVDPENDTVEKLHDYAERFGAREGWSFLSGDPEQVDFILGRLGQAVEEPESHTSIMVVGNLRTGLWKKAQGLASGEDLIAVVDSVLRDEGATHAGP